MSGTTLLDQFSALEDPRQAWKVVYPLPEILLSVLCASLAGADDFVEIERWANRKLDFLRRFLPFENGIPSHDTLNDVFNALPAGAFSDCFVAWVESLRGDDPDIVAIDGKTSRRAHDRNHGKNPCTSSPPGPAANGSCWANRHARKNPTKSPPSRRCSTAWN